MNTRILPLLLLTFFACSLGAGAQAPDPLAGSTWDITENYTTPSAAQGFGEYLFNGGNVFDQNDGSAQVGSYTVAGTGITMDISSFLGNTSNPVSLHLTGTFSSQTKKMSGSFTGTITNDNTSASGAFTAVGRNLPQLPIGKLTFQELDSQFVYRPATGTDTFNFTLFKITVSGSITLDKFPITDPQSLMLSPDTELDVQVGEATSIFGGKLSEADPRSTDSHKLFKLLPFAADSFFDALPTMGPKGYRTGDPTLTIAWSLSGPHDKPATLLKFSVIAVGRAWTILANPSGGNGNSQGLAGPNGLANLGKPSGKTLFGTPTGNALPCTITFADGARNVTANFTLAGAAQIATKSSFDPKLKVELKTSTFSQHGTGPEKTH